MHSLDKKEKAFENDDKKRCIKMVNEYLMFIQLI